MKQVIVNFRKERETKGAVLYNEVDDSNAKIDQASAKIGNQYIRKSTFNGSAPEILTITISYE